MDVYNMQLSVFYFIFFYGTSLELSWALGMCVIQLAQNKGVKTKERKPSLVHSSGGQEHIPYGC